MGPAIAPGLPISALGELGSYRESLRGFQEAGSFKRYKTILEIMIWIRL